MIAVSYLWRRAVGACGRRTAKWANRRLFSINPGRPIISFTFDDFPRSALAAGGAILEERNLVGTFYASLGLAGQVTEAGEMLNVKDLVRLLEAGHELGCHTYHHCPAWETPPDRFEMSVRRNAEELTPLSGARFQTLSYPISPPNPETKRRMSQYFACCRGGGGPKSFNAGTVDLNYLDALFIEQCHGRLQIIRSQIAAACLASGWLIFATHDVSPHPSRFGCSPRFFQSVVDCAVQSGAEILPVCRALKELERRAQPARMQP